MSDNEYPDEYLDENGNEYQEEKPEQERGELRPCPFCGTLPQANAWIFRGISETRYFCPNQECPLSVRTVTLEEWNTRPIEDALNARIAELEAENERLSQLLHDEMSQLEIATDLGNKRWTALNKIYNDAVSAGKVSVDVKRDLSDAEITRLENRFADTEACNGRLVKQVEQLTAENKRLKAVLNEWDMAWLTDCIAPQPNGNEAFGLDEGLVLCARMMKPILEETRLLLGKAEVVG